MADRELTSSAERTREESWTIRGRNVLITGASSGVGLAAARGLAARGAHLWLLCRDAQRGEAALASCRAMPGAGRLELLLADLSSQRETRAVAAKFLGRNEPLHVLVNNAAAVFLERTETMDGVESTLAVNHVAPFLLTNLLLPRLLESAPARVINVASAGHRTGRIRIDDLGCRVHSYQGLVQYSHTKLANVLFTRELARRIEGTGVVAHSLHPGVIRTGLGMNNTGWLRVAWNGVRPLFSSPEKGADTVVFLACDADVQGTNGAYWARRKPRRPGARGRDDEMAARLWEATEALAGIPGSSE